MFNKLQQNSFHAKASKCVFGFKEISFLGHRILGLGIAPDQDKISAIQQWPSPHSFTMLREFLGLTGYYRQFVPQYAHITSPLIKILKQKNFSLSSSSEVDFTTLKSQMQQLVTLALPNFQAPFDVTTDTSGQAIGAFFFKITNQLLSLARNFVQRFKANRLIQRSYTR